MQLGNDQRKLQRALGSPAPQIIDFGLWIRDEQSVLQGWETRGATHEEIPAASAHDELLLRRGSETPLYRIPVHEFVEAMKSAVASSTRSLDQSEAFRTAMVKKFAALAPLNGEHFLVRYCAHGVQSKFLPSQFGVFLRFLDSPDQSVLMIFRKGKLDGYATPDLSGFHGRFLNGMGARGTGTVQPSKAPPARDAIGRRAAAKLEGAATAPGDRIETLASSPGEFTVVGRASGADGKSLTRFLKTRYGVPIQLIECTRSDWQTVCASTTPWRTFLQGIRTKTFTLTPFRWSLVFGWSLKAFFGK